MVDLEAPVGERRARRRRAVRSVTGALPPQPRWARVTAGSTVDDVVAHAVAAHHGLRQLVVAVGVGRRSPRQAAARRRRARRPRRRSKICDEADQPHVIGVLVGDDDPLEGPPAGDRPRAPRSPARPARWPRLSRPFDQRQRVVVDQMAIDPADPERRGDRRADRAVRRPDQRQRRSSRRRSMSAWRSGSEVQAQQRLGVRGADVEVPGRVVDESAHRAP